MDITSLRRRSRPFFEWAVTRMAEPMAIRLAREPLARNCASFALENAAVFEESHGPQTRVAIRCARTWVRATPLLMVRRNASGSTSLTSHSLPSRVEGLTSTSSSSTSRSKRSVRLSRCGR